MPPRENFYGELRALRDSIRADEQYLANAPIGARKKKQLRESIAKQKARLKELNKELREWKQSQKAE